MSRSRSRSKDAPPKPGTIGHTLSVLVSGGKLVRERVYPFPPKLMLSWIESGMRREKVLSESLVQRMVTGGLIAPDNHAISKTPDAIPFFLTEKGTQEAAA